MSDNKTIRVVQGEVVDETELVLAASAAPRQRAAAEAVLAQMLRAARQLSEEELLDRWEEAILGWIEAKGGKSGSPHTREAYRQVVDQWLMFIGARLRLVSAARREGYRQQVTRLGQATAMEPWQVGAGDVLRWMTALRGRGLKAATVNHRLAVMSSLYKFVCRTRWIDEVGVERGIFVDAAGTPRENPFLASAIDRPRTEAEAEQPQPLSERAVAAMLGSCNQQTRTGARNFALLRTFVLTGWRANEVLTMQWGRIRENPKFAGEWLYQWRGKGGKTELEPLPASCYYAIVAYLKLDGRWPVVDDEMFVWQAVSRHGVGNFGADAARLEGQPIGQTQANNILRKHLRGVVSDPRRFHVHSLRHTHADQHYDAFKDLRATQKRLHHASPATTARYLQRMQSPQDDFSKQLELRLGI